MKIKRNSILSALPLSVLMLISFNAYSQNQQIKDKKFDFIPKSPDVASLGKYIDKPISLSSGSANVNIPLYSLNINDNISIPINLIYNSQGVKVSETVSSVGLGWDLSCLSFVTRNIRGKEDNYIDPDFYNQNNTLAKQNLASNATSTYPNAWLDQNSNAVDTEPDEFSVSLFNQSFKFYYDFKTQKFIQTPQSDIKIIPNISTNGNIIDMKIVDTSGNTYYFGRSYDEDNNVAVVDELGSININTESAYTSGVQPKINTWHLVKIETSDKKTVKFFYDENYVPVTDMNKQNIQLAGQYKYMFNTLDFANGTYNNVQWVNGNPVVVGNLYPVSYGIYSQNKEGIDYNIYSIPNTQDKILKKIVYDKTQIEFEKSAMIRKDQNNYSYEKINVKYDGRTVKSFSLNHTYFNDEYGFISSDHSRSHNYIFSDYFDKSHYRLKLNSVSEYGINNSFTGNYSFDYYAGQLPSKLSFAQDFFGYYNGKTTNTELIPNVYFKLENVYKKAGTAERNVDLEFSKIGALKSITYPTKGKTEFEYENHSFMGINDITETPMNNDLFSLETHNITFAAEQNADPNTGAPLPLNTIYQQEIIFDQNSTADLNTYIQQVPQNPSNPGSLMNSFYIKVYKVENDGSHNLLFSITSTQNNTPYLFQKGKYLFEATRMTHTINEGGLQEEEGSFAMTISYQNGVSYEIDNSPTSHIAGGLRIKSITQKDSNDNTLLKTEYKYEDIINGQKYSSGILYGYPLIVSNNYYFGVNKFYGLIDFPLKGGSSHSVLYAKVTEESVDNNQNRIRKIYHFDNNFIPPINETNSDVRLKTPNFGWRIGNLKEIEYYKSGSNNSFSLVKKDSIIYNQKGTFTSNELGVSIEPRDVISYTSLFDVTKYKYEYYPLYTDFNYEATKITKEYIDNAVVSTTTTNNFNNINTYELTASKTQFADGSITETNYQYAHEKNNQLLISKNMIGIPLETTVTQTVGGVTKTLGKTETVYPASLPTPQAGNLVLPTAVKSYDLNNTPATDVTYDQYDIKGNLQQYTTKDGISTTIIWGYNQMQPIAKIIGVKLSDISQTLINSIVTASNTDASAAPGNDESAFLALLDSFRKDPSMAGYQVTTYTYDPLIGVRSITPPSGIREVYLYDSANRLKEIRENGQTGNILKEFKYNYKN